MWLCREGADEERKAMKGYYVAREGKKYLDTDRGEWGYVEGGGGEGGEGRKGGEGGGRKRGHAGVGKEGERREVL